MTANVFGFPKTLWSILSHVDNFSLNSFDFFLWFSVPPISFSVLWTPLQEHQLKLILASFSCSINFIFRSMTRYKFSSIFSFIFTSVCAGIDKRWQIICLTVHLTALPFTQVKRGTFCWGSSRGQLLKRKDTNPKTKPSLLRCRNTG